MLGPYDEIKERLNKFYGTKDTQQTRLMSSAAAGFSAAFLSLPFDNAKTKMQKMKPLPDGTFPYKNIQHCMMTSAKNEGIAGLWVGFPTYYFRIAPHVMIVNNYIYIILYFIFILYLDFDFVRQLDSIL